MTKGRPLSLLHICRMDGRREEGLTEKAGGKNEKSLRDREIINSCYIYVNTVCRKPCDVPPFPAREIVPPSLFPVFPASPWRQISGFYRALKEKQSRTNHIL